MIKSKYLKLHWNFYEGVSLETRPFAHSLGTTMRTWQVPKRKKRIRAKWHERIRAKWHARIRAM
jgi:hypothetical protein